MGCRINRGLAPVKLETMEESDSLVGKETVELILRQTQKGKKHSRYPLAALKRQSVKTFLFKDQDLED